MATKRELVFIYDEDGNEYACPADALKGKIKKSRALSKEEKENCLNLTEVFSKEKKNPSK